MTLQRRISTELGSNSILIEDIVTNLGFSPQPHLILYHCNLGFPLVSEHTRLMVDVEDTIPRDADAVVGLDQWSEFQAPTPGYSEQVFRHVPRANDEGKVNVVLRILNLAWVCGSVSSNNNFHIWWNGK